VRPRGGALGPPGFQPGAEHIAPAGDETTAGVLALLTAVMHEKNLESEGVYTAEGVNTSMSCTSCAAEGAEGGHEPRVLRLLFAYHWYPRETTWSGLPDPKP